MIFDASTAEISHHLPGPHLTRSLRAFSRAAHHAPPLTAAAHAGLAPPPARRYRRANNLHHSNSTAVSRPAIHHQPTLHARVHKPNSHRWRSSVPPRVASSRTRLRRSTGDEQLGARPLRRAGGRP